MTPRRRYTRKEKVTAVVAAVTSNPAAAAEKLGIPKRTLDHWLEDPAMAQLAMKTREDLAKGSMVLAHRTLAVIQARLEDFEPRDLSVLFGILVDKGQLLAGQATERHETKDITASLDDHERDALADAIDEWVHAHA